MVQNRMEISWQSLWRIVIFAGLLVAFYLAREVVGVLLVSVVLALGLDPIVSFLESKKIPRLLGTFMVFVFGIAIFVAAVYLFIPILIVEVSGFLANFNESLSSVFGISLPETTLQALNLNLNQALAVLSAAKVSITGAIGSILNKLILFVATIILSFYLTIERGGTERLLAVILPDEYEKSVMTVFDRFKKKIRRWFSAQLALSVVVGVLVAAGLGILGVRYAFILGILAAVFELVPIIGPIATGVIGVMAALTDSTSLAIWTGILFIGIQQLENHVLLPLVMGRAMKVHPVVVIGALLAGGHIAGFVGVLLSVPIAVLFQEIFNHLSELKNERATIPT